MNLKPSNEGVVEDVSILGMHLEQRNNQLSNLYEISNRLDYLANRIGFNVDEIKNTGSTISPESYLEINQANIDGIYSVLERINNTLSSIERL